MASTPLTEEGVELVSRVCADQENPPEKLKILLVDDNPGKLLSHEAVLNELGESVLTATSGREALQVLLREDVAVILLDVNMPEIDGFETARLIRERPRFEQTPIIFVTAYNTTDLDRLHGYKLGAVDYLFLPIVPEVLKAKVKAFVSLARQNHVIRRQAERLAYHNQQQARQIQMIQELNRTLTAANQELESFSYTISHDLRAPLRALKGYSELLLEGCTNPNGFDETAVDCIKRIHGATISLDNLTHDLLEYSHIAREKVQLAPVSLEQVMEEVVRINPLLQTHGVEISRNGGLEPVLAHKSLLTHCLGNLLSNAVKFVAPGVKPSVLLRTTRVGDRVRIYVEDNGIGIDPAHHKRIFGLFERVGDVRRYEGTGVGLAIVARAAERMGGCCGLHSKPQAGSSFWIELAAAPVPTTHPVTSCESGREPAEVGHKAQP